MADPQKLWCFHFIFVLLLAASGGCSGEVSTTRHSTATSSRDTLILVMNQETRHLVVPHLDAYERLAPRLAILDTGDGVPGDVHGAPLILFQNHRGRSIFQGRYADETRLLQFVRTARVIPQSLDTVERTSIPAWTSGRLTIATPLKITNLDGDVPEGFDAERFREDAIRAIDEGLTHFDLRERVALGRSDRLFYLDFHPYRSGEQLLISCEIYSQFNCHVPIESLLTKPFVGTWAARDELFQAAAAVLETKIVEHLEGSTIGDAYAALPADTSEVTWASLGLKLPPAPLVGVSLPADVGPLPTRWSLDAAGTADPGILFHFAAPLDNMAGEASFARLELDISRGEGVFAVGVRSVSMGDPLLDEFIHGAETLDAARHPEAFFMLDRLESETNPAFGELTRFAMHGLFHMKGRSAPVTVRSSLDPFIDDAGRVRMRLQADWSIRLADAYGISGTDGPAPANDTVLFQCDVVLQPTDPQ